MIANGGPDDAPGAGHALAFGVSQARPLKVRFASDSLLEGNGFELPVPGREAVNRDGRRTGCPEIGTDLLRNRRFESISLHRRVRCEPDFRLPSQRDRSTRSSSSDDE
jgi:hypothetical protein